MKVFPPMQKVEPTWMRRALELAEQAALKDEVPVGAVVVLDGDIIGEGQNTRESAHDPCGHAEIHALQAAAQKLGDWRLVGATLVVTLEPCPMCLAACQLARVERVIYAADDPKGGALSLGYRLHEDARTNHRFQTEKVEEPKAQFILTEFFRGKRKKG